MKKLPATLLCDFYKVSHREQYPEGTEVVYSTWTARGSRKKNINSVVAFGFQYFIKKYLIAYFNDNFFSRPLDEVVKEYTRVIKYSLGVSNPDSTHIEKLHKLGYLPLEIKAVKEGTLVPLRVPILTIENTHTDFYWLTNYIETLFSNEMWMPITSATIAYEYKKILNKYAELTSDSVDFVPFQGHDFSMRGMSSLESAGASGAGHLLSFTGTDTIPAILFHENYYNANIEEELVGTSIPATEHSVMCSYGEDKEFETYKRLITDIYPTGIMSIVSDTWDLWKVLSDIILPLKQEILNRDGKVVIRPDSGDPVNILCGDINSNDVLEQKGVVGVLWDIFGGTINSKGYKELDSHIGAIYGDAITLERAEEICKRLKEKGFASTNVVYGIGSYSYQGNTRDTFGFAIKSTYAKVSGEDRMIFKNPKTDDGLKKSQKGKVVVYEEYGELKYKDGLISDEGTILETVFKNGKLKKETSLKEIRNRLK